MFAQDKKGPLADLPSKPGAHVEKIKAMGDNEWLKLGAPAADPKWGKARGSAWGAKALILAPDKRGAFLYGEGVHAYVKPDGHVMDDLWFYDINQHAWLCLHPGTDTKTFTQRVKDGQLLIDENGQLIDDGNRPVPLHPLVHAWGYLAYDSDRKKFAFLSWSAGPVPRYFLGGEKQMDEGLKLLEGQLKGKKKAVFSPWFYDVASGRFERSPTANPTAINAGGFPATPLPPLPEAVPRRGVRHGGDLRPGEEPLDRRQAQRAVAQGVRRLRLPRHQAGPHLPKRRRRLEGGRTDGLRHRGQHLEPPEAHRDRTGAGQHERSVLRV